MVETRPFKTKLCALYQRGRCGRRTCTFAHGNAELRRYSGSFADRRNDRGNDLRNKLERRRSPLRRISPGRDARGWPAGQRSSPPRPIKRRKYRTHDHMDVQSDFSGSFKVSDGTVERGKDKKLASSDSRNMLEDELKEVQYEVDVLLDQKSQLEIELGERTQEADVLSSRIRDLEAQLSVEKDKSKRVKSKFKKLIRAHVHHTRMQDELKRSQVQLEKLVEELGLDGRDFGQSEDNSNVNIISGEELPKLKEDYRSPARKQLHSSMEAKAGSKLANITKGHGISHGSSQRNSQVPFDGNQEAEVGFNRKQTSRLKSNESKPKQRKDVFKSSSSSYKLKVVELNNLAPPTSMAAHADDDFVEQIEAEEKTEVVETPTVENGLPLPLPPLRSVSPNKCFQYEGDDENVDVDGVEEELLEGLV